MTRLAQYGKFGLLFALELQDTRMWDMLLLTALWLLLHTLTTPPARCA